MVRYKFMVPPTMEVGSFSGICDSYNDTTYQQDALWQYNSAREHDGLPPLKRMPKGTKYIKIN